MRQRYLAAAALMAVMVAAASAAIADDRETVNGVTVLRGKTPTEETPGAATTGNLPMSGGGSGGSYTIDQSGKVNALHTGSANAGGEIANPPPGAGR